MWWNPTSSSITTIDMSQTGCLWYLILSAWKKTHTFVQALFICFVSQISPSPLLPKYPPVCGSGSGWRGSGKACPSWLLQRWTRHPLPAMPLYVPLSRNQGGWGLWIIRRRGSLFSPQMRQVFTSHFTFTFCFLLK